MKNQKSTKPTPSTSLRDTENRVSFSTAVEGAKSLPNQRLLAMNKALTKNGRKRK
jgi:hypothetical protein